MIRVGLTGGIGTGKSTVARIFGTLGIPVYYADKETKKLMNENAELRQQIIRHFGAGSYQDGKLNRAYLASKVFNDPDQLLLLNSITHPPSIEHANQWAGQFDPDKTAFTIKEAALLFESGSVRNLDFVIGVFSPMALRIKRIMDRDGITAEEIQQRIDRQMDENIKMKLCDAVIINDEVQMIIPQVLDLYELLKNKKPAGKN
ncbi:MAG: dephospho-CoA kinase [Chitinophagaceae bacterium]